MSKREKNFSGLRLGRSFRAAASGLGQTLRTEQNMRIHFAIVILVGIAGWWLRITLMEWLLICLCIGAVISTELLNTAIEYLADTVRDKMSLDYEATRYPRDMAAAAVLVMSVIAVIVGLAIFIPRIILKFS